MCACKSRDPKLCASIRYNLELDEMERGDECQCDCHWADDEEEYE